MRPIAIDVAWSVCLSVCVSVSVSVCLCVYVCLCVKPAEPIAGKGAILGKMSRPIGNVCIICAHGDVCFGQITQITLTSRLNYCS